MPKTQIERRKYAKKVKKLGKKSSLGNDKCADCNLHRTSWVSIKIGCFLCMRCSSIHRNLGREISVIKSLDLDSWNYKTYKLLKSKGGNKKINKFYESECMAFDVATKPNINK